MDEEQVTSIEVENNEDYDDDAAIRAQAAVNSPKGDNGMTFNDDDENDGNNNGMSLNLGDVDEDEDDYNPANATPNTKLRNQADVNSPRAKLKQKWGADETDSSAAVAGLMTQVSKEDAKKYENGNGGVSGLVTQVS